MRRVGHLEGIREGRDNKGIGLEDRGKQITWKK
jgi:hypothetical protein